MRKGFRSRVGGGGLIVLAAIGCNAVPQTPAVEFATRQPIGRWQDGLDASGAMARLPTAGSGANAGGALAPVPMVGTTVPTNPSLGAPGVPQAGVTSAGRAGAGGAVAAAIGGNAALAGNGAAAGAMAAGAGGTAADGGGTTSVTFNVTTLSQGGFYQPRNIGAIWIQDSSGKFVKSLEVWAGIRSRYLSKYSSARAGMPVDVTASATLSSHRAHHATWNMKDHSGQTMPPGKYTVVIEVTDTDFPGQSDSVDFDTSKGPMQLMPPNAMFYTTMSLTMQ